MSNKPNMDLKNIKRNRRMFNCTLSCVCTYFQLQKYGQYGMHGSIIDVPTNLRLIQNVMPQMPYDDSSISIFSKGKLEYKFIYIYIYIYTVMFAQTWS